MAGRILIKKRQAILLATTGSSLAVFAFLAMNAAGGFAPQAIESTRALATLGARAAQMHCAHAGDDLPELATALAARDPLPADHRQLVAAIVQLATSTRKPARLQGRVDELTARLSEQVSAFQAEQPQIQGVALLNEVGVVVFSGSPRIKAGAKLLDQEVDEIEEVEGPVPAQDVGEDGQETAEPDGTGATSPSRSDGVAQVFLTGRAAKAVQVDETGVYLLGAAPIYLRNRISGAVVLERRLQSLPQLPGTQILLLSGSDVLLGRPPAAWPLPLAETEEPFLLHARQEELGMFPLFVDSNVVGTWARRFPFSGSRQIEGLVMVDPTPWFAELAGWQLLMLVAALLFFAVQAAILLFAGRSFVAAVGQITDFLGRCHQGLIEERELKERNFAPELARLVRLVNQTVAVASFGSAAGALPKSPTVDQVLKAHNPDTDPSTQSAGGKHRKPDPEGFEPPGDRPTPAEEALVADPMAALAPGGDQDLSDYSNLPTSPEGFDLPDDDEPPESIDPADLEEVEHEDSMTSGGMEGHALQTLETLDEEPEEPTQQAEDKPYRTVYEDFLATRKKCGESSALPFDKFVARLEKSRAAVLSKHRCADVRFQVYVKDGRAALKATPVGPPQ